MIFETGYAQKTITPPLTQPVYLAGFGQNRQAETVHDDLFVRALALRSEKILLIVVALDLIGLSRQYCQQIESKVKQQLPEAQLLIACTHTHHGPHRQFQCPKRPFY